MSYFKKPQFYQLEFKGTFADLFQYRKLFILIFSVDKILKGGLLTGNVYEVCGFPNCGKTQFCLTILKNVADTLKQSVYIIDTKRDFSGKRIKTMLNSKNSSDVMRYLKCNLKY